MAGYAAVWLCCAVACVNVFVCAYFEVNAPLGLCCYGGSFQLAQCHVSIGVKGVYRSRNLMLIVVANSSVLPTDSHCMLFL